MKMEDFYSLEDRNNDMTSECSSDESLYYSASSSPDLSSYEELTDYAYLSETDSLSVYSGSYEPDIGQVNPTIYPAPAHWIEVLGIFPTEVGGTTYYQPLFYYVPVYDNLYCPLSPDVPSEQYETENTEYCCTDSETDFSSSSSDTYYTAEESEYYFNPDEHDCEAEEVFYLNDVEKTNFERSVNDESDLSRDKLCPEPESSENNYEENYFDNIEKKNDVNFKRRKSDYLPNNETNNDNGYCRSKNSAYICDEKGYNDILHHADNSFEKKESKSEKDFNSESYGENEYFSSGNLARSYDDNEFEDITTLSENSVIENLEKTFKSKLVIDKTKMNEVMISSHAICDSSADNTKSNKVDKHLPVSITDISERQEFSEKFSTNTLEFGDVNNKNYQKQGLKKCNTFKDLSDSKQEQFLKKHDSFENLSRFQDNEKYEKDFPCDNPEIGTDSYECDLESLSFDPEDFEFTEEEVKYMKDEIYRRALSGKLYQKTHIPSVAVLPTIYEENECFGEIDEHQAGSQASCLMEQQGRLSDSLCNLYEMTPDNEETSEESQQKPKKKRMKRLREFLARIFCCVKPP